MKKNKNTEGRRHNSFEEGMLSIYLANWIKQNDPERYKEMVKEAEEAKKGKKTSGKGEWDTRKRFCLNA